MCLWLSMQPKKSRLSSVKLKTALNKKLDKPTNSYSNVKRIIVYPSSFVNALIFA